MLIAELSGMTVTRAIHILAHSRTFSNSVRTPQPAQKLQPTGQVVVRGTPSCSRSPIRARRRGYQVHMLPSSLYSCVLANFVVTIVCAAVDMQK